MVSKFATSEEGIINKARTKARVTPMVFDWNKKYEEQVAE